MYHSLRLHPLARFLRVAIETLEATLFPESRNHKIVDLLSYRDVNTLYRERHGRVTTLLPYYHPSVRSLMWEMKYHKNARAYELLAYALGKHMREHGDGRKSDRKKRSLLVPIPLSRRRLTERGYNQVELLLEKLDLFMAAPHIETRLLYRRAHRKSQTALGKAERLKNLFGAFAVRDINIPKDTEIILVDDTMATGATMRSALSALRDAGFARVRPVALAH